MSTRRSRPVARARSKRQLIPGLAILGSVLLAVGAIFGYVVSTSGSTSSAPQQALTTPKTSAQAFNATLTRVFSNLGGVLVVGMLKATDAWAKGTATADSVTAEMNHVLPAYISVRATLAKEAPFPGIPNSLRYYQQAANVYEMAVRTELAATKLPVGPLQTQMQMSFKRVYNLGDRLFDLAQAAMAPALPPVPAADPSFQYQKVADVPDFTAIGIEAGPPLDGPPPAITPALTQYQDTRPQEPFAQWAGAVRAEQLPTASQEASAIRAKAVETLQSQSDQFAAATVDLTGTPDPAGARPTSTALRLGLLVDAEATRAAEAAGMVRDLPVGKDLTTIAETLALTGDNLWDPAVAPRATGFPQSLLVAHVPNVTS